MEFALGLLAIWTLLFFPLGLAVHWLVLGTSARLQASTVALLSGIALAIVVLSVLRELGVPPGSAGIAWAFALVSLVVCVALWRRQQRWRHRGLWGVGTLLVMVAFLYHLPAYDGPQLGPLGDGSGHEPVGQVALIDAFVPGSGRSNDQVRAASAQAGDRYSGFEQFAALTVGLGEDEKPVASADPRDAGLSWNAYSLHSLITAMLLTLVVLPLHVLARWRGVGVFGEIILMFVGALSPVLMVALGLAQGPAVASVPFAVGAVLSLLIARRDRGWFALAVLYGAAVLLIAGPVALLPIVLIGVAWVVLQRRAREHLKHTDLPVEVRRPLAFAVATAALALVGCFGAIADASPLNWQRLHDSLDAALLSWPFSWLGSAGEVAGPRRAPEFALWLTGPALLAIAVAYGVARREVRELAVLAGVAASLAVGVVLAGFDASFGVRVVEYTWLVASPLLAMVAIRTTGLARAVSRETDSGRFAGGGPVLLIAVVGLFSVAAAGVTGTRLVNAAPLAAGGLPTGGNVLVAATDEPWLPYIIDGELARGRRIDADQMAESRNPHSSQSLVYGDYDAVVLQASPISSDPPWRYQEQTGVPEGVRLFLDTVGDADKDVAGQVDVELEGDEADDAAQAEGDGGAPAPATAPAEAKPDKHYPVEPEAPGAGQAGGALVPGASLDNCGVDQLPRPCEPKRPAVEDDCTSREVAAAHSEFDDRANRRLVGPRRPTPDALVALGGTASTAPDRQQEEDTGNVRTDTRTDASRGLEQSFPEEPVLLGVACWTIELPRRDAFLQLHVRDVGLVLAAPDAREDGPVGSVREDLDNRKEPLLGGDWLRTSSREATVTYGNDHLVGAFELVLEGDLGAGVSLRSTGGPQDAATQRPVRSLSNGFSAPVVAEAPQQLAGRLVVENLTGSSLRLGRLFARPVDMSSSCDMHIPAVAGARTERLIDDFATGEPYPGLVFSLTSITGDGTSTGGVRRGRLVLGSYLQRNGLPRHVLADWVEIFPEERPQQACTGTYAVKASIIQDGREVGAKDVGKAIGGPAGGTARAQS